jgi:hypothetical protein
MTKILSTVPVYDGKLFSWSKSTGTTEASTLSPNLYPWGRLERDALDVGFYVRSHKTGVTKLFVLVDCEVEGTEVTSWTLTPADSSDVKITVLND